MQSRNGNIPKIKTFVACLVVILSLSFLMSKRHEHTGYFNWRSELWADQAGYYVYLPGLFIYDFNPAYFPDKIEEKTGDGFTLDYDNQKVITRYTCGLAILQSPFFMIIHLYAGLVGLPQDGFSGIYHNVPNLAALFYSFFGLLFLWKFLLFYYSRKVSFFTIVALFFGTNLYYYAIDNTGMSHIYSFALFALIAWFTKRFITGKQKPGVLTMASWGAIFALIVLIRPSNILLFPFLFCLDCKSWLDLRKRLKVLFNLRLVLPLVGISLLVFLPQFLYWKYASGNFISYSYEGYGFSNWKTPQILGLWFSPNNGLFLYSPLYLFFLVGMYLMIRDKLINGWLAALTFIGITYVFASWFLFSFGCGFGSRNYVEYLVLFALPFGYLILKIVRLKLSGRIPIIAAILFLILFNQKLIYSYNKCFQGGSWDFQEYAYLLKNKKYHHSMLLQEDKYLSSDNEYSKGIKLHVDSIACVNFRRAIVRSKVIVEAPNSEALLVLSIESGDSSVYWNAFRFGDQISANQLCTEQIIEGDYWLPLHFSTNSTISAYVWNKNRENMTVNELDLFLE